MIRSLKFKFQPVAWMTTILGGLIAVAAFNEAAHLLPAAWSPYLLGAITVLTAILGALAKARVTPTAAPRDDAGNRLVPAGMRAGRQAPPDVASHR